MAQPEQEGLGSLGEAVPLPPPATGLAGQMGMRGAVTLLWLRRAVVREVVSSLL